MSDNSKLNGVYQYIDDIISQTENDEKYLSGYLKDHSKKISDNFAPYFKTFLGIMSAWGAIVIPIQVFDFTFSLVLFAIFGILILILYLIKNNMISKISDATYYKESMLIKKKDLF